MRAARLVALVLLALATCATAGEDDLEPLMPAPAGPYRGTVVDAASKRPLANAAVVLIWQRPDDQFPQRRRTAAVTEAITDGAGQFVFNVRPLEARLVPRSFGPRIVIFKPGYTPYPPVRSLFPPGASAGQFTGTGAEVALTPVTDYEDRAEAFNQFYEVLSAHQVPPDDIPQTWQAVKEELERLMAPIRNPGSPGGRK
jgi:hypothetical protein